ncbi:MAG TPA: hypothetical protein VLC74_05135 [Rhizomicrobium sp.]|nr:hypothetical protein [Rhizomicrobium sp.]
MKLLSIFAALSLIGPAGATLAASYSGNWPITVTNSQYGNGVYCLSVKDDGSLRFPHSGFVSLTGPGGNLPYGTFELIGHFFTVTVEQQGETQNAGLVFVAHASNGSIGNGIYDQVYGGEEFDSGKAAFGLKGGC